MKLAFRLKLLALLLAAMPIQKTLAASGTWNVDSGGIWNAAGNWTPAAVPGTAAGDAVGLTFNISAARIVTNNTTVTVGTLNIGDTDNSAAYTLTNNSGNTFTFNNSGSGAQLNQSLTSKGDTIATPFVLGDNLTVNNASGNTFTLGGIISGTKALTFNSSGSGLVNLTAANSFSGGVTNLSGVVGVSQGPSFGAAPGSPAIQFTFAGNSTMQWQADVTSGSALNINRGFQVNSGVTGAVDVNGHTIWTRNQWKSIGSGQILFENSSTTAATLLLGNNSGEADNSSLGAMVAAGTTLQLNRASSSSVHNIGGNGLTVRGGIVQLSGGGGDQIYDGAPVTVNVGTFDMKGTNETIGSLAGLAGTVTNSGTVASTLTIGGTLGTGAGNYQGNIKDNAANGGTLNLVKAGTGTLILGGTNTYAGTTTISAGTLQLQPSPTVPFASGLVYQLDASTLGLGNGASVTTVPDSSGNGNTATNFDAANPPTYNTTGLNGKGTIHFVNTANVGLQTTNNSPISGSGARSVFAVMSRSSGGSMLLSWGNTAGGNLFDLTIENNGKYYLPAVYSGGDNTFSTPPVDTKAHLCEVTYDGGVSESGYLDGSLLGTKTLGGALSTTAAPLQIGYRSGDANKALGDVAEVLIYNTALTSAQRQQVETYLLNKWFGNVGGPANVLPRATTVSLASGATLDVNGTPQTVAVLADVAGAGGLVTNSAASTPVTLTLAPSSGSATFSGNINDNGSANAISLTVNGTSGTQILNGANTFHGITIITGGTLALGASGSIANTANIAIGAGATFDVSAIASYSLTSPMTASGTASAANLKGGTTISVGSIPLNLNFTPTLFFGDTTHPALTVTSGALDLGTSTVTVTNNGASPLGAGDYTLISGGTVSGSPTLNPLGGVGAGAGIVGNGTASLLISGGNLILHVITTAVSTTTTISLHSGWTSSSTYGDALQFDVTVTGFSPSGTVTLKDGGVSGTTIGSGTLSGGSATVIVNPLNSLTTGTHTNILAIYGGDSNNSGSASAALTNAQVVSTKALTVSGAAAQDKYFDGTTNATITGSLVGVLSGDTVTLVGTGYFASPNIGTGISVIAACTLGGSSATNYTLSAQPTGLSANIYGVGVWTGATADTFWNTAGNWNPNLVPSGANVTADFSTLDIAADQTVNLNSARTIGNLIFGDTDTSTAAGWTLANNGVVGNALTLAGTTPTINVAALGTNKKVTISANIAGTSGLTKTGNGTLALTGTNAYSGSTVISNGTLQFNADINLGSGSVTLNGGTLASLQSAQVTMTRTISAGVSGGTIQMNNGTPTSSANKIVLYTAGQITGSGPITVVSNGLISIGAVNAGYSGNWTINGGVMELVGNHVSGTGGITVNSGGELTTLGSQITNALTLNGGLVGWDFFSGSGDYQGPVTLQSGGGTVSLVNFYGSGAINGTISGSISGSGVLATSPTGPGATTFGGILTVSGNNSFAGGTAVGLGTTLKVANTNALGANTNALFVAGTLDLNNKSVMQGTLTTSNGATFDFTLGASSVNQLNVASASVSGTNYIGMSASGGITAGTYNLINASGGGLTGNYLFTGNTNSIVLNDGSGNYFTLTLNNTDTAEQLVVTSLAITNGLVVMPFGSSISAGQSAQSSYQGGGYRTGLYLSLAGDGRFTPSFVGSDVNLLANSPTNVNPLTTANQLHHEGHPGWNTMMMLANINANDGNAGGNGGYWLAPSNGVNPNYITVNIGGNDAVNYGTDSATLTSAAQRLDAIVSDFNTLRPGVNTILSTIVYRGDNSGSYSAGLDAYYNPAIGGVAFNHVLAGQSVRYLDLRTIINYPADISSDNIHPTQTGYDKMANAWHHSLIYGAAYWTGSQDGVWNTVNGSASNWAMDTARAYDRQKSLNDSAAITYGIYPDVFFNSNTGAVTTTLGVDTTIRSLNFTKDATGSVTIGAGNTLTIGSIDTNVISGNTYTLMNSGGITVQAGSGAHTLAASVMLGADQTWGNVSSNAFTVSGAVGGTNRLSIVGSYTIYNPDTYTSNANPVFATYSTAASNYVGTGSIVLSGNNTYSGGTTIGSGTLIVSGQSSPNSGTGSGAVALNGGTLSGNGRIAGSVMISNSAPAILYPNNLTGGTLTFGGNLTFAGSNAGIKFNVSSNNISGNDKVVLENTTLTCGGAQITISNLSGSALSAADYMLFDVGASGTISGSFNSTPVWSGATPKYAAQYSIQAVGKTVVLHFAPIALTVTAAADAKLYDGTTNAAVAPTISSGTLETDDALNASESYADKHAGAGKTLTPIGIVVDAGTNDVTARYAISFVANNSGVITPTNLTMTAVASTKQFDDTTAAAALPVVTAGSIQAGDTANFTESYDNKNVGTGKTLTPAGSVNDGNGGLNYNVTFVPVSTGIITAVPPAQIEISGGTVSLTFYGIVNSNYVVQVSTNLLSAWSNLSTNTVGTNGWWQITDADATNDLQRFYRAVTP